MTKTFSKLILIAIFVFPMMLIGFLNFQSSDSTNLENFDNEEFCTVSVEDYVQFLEKNDVAYKIFPSELSLYPEIKNFKCLNKVMFRGEVSSVSANLGVGSSQNFFCF
jgi:hypothetical protein